MSYIDDLKEQFRQEMFIKVMDELSKRGIDKKKAFYQKNSVEQLELVKIIYEYSEDSHWKAYLLNDPKVAALLAEITGYPGPCKLLCALRTRRLAPKFNNLEHYPYVNIKNPNTDFQLRAHIQNAKRLLPKMAQIGIVKISVVKKGSDVISLTEDGEIIVDELFDLIEENASQCYWRPSDA